MSVDLNREPKLQDVLDDPLVHLVMARDGLSPEEVRRVVADASRRLTDRRRREEMRDAA